MGIYNSNSNTLISGSLGNDVIMSSSGANNVTIDGAGGKDTLKNWGTRTTFIGREDDDYIYNEGGSATVFAGDGNDLIENYGSYSLIYGEGGNDTVDNKSSGDHSTIAGGKGDDLLKIYDYEDNNVIQYAEGDGNDVVINTCIQGHFDATLSITNGSYTQVLDGNDLLVKVGNGSIRFKDMANTKINIEGTAGTSTIDNSTNIVISGNTWTYSGGNKYIDNYKQGEVVQLDSDYQGIDLQGNSFFVKSSSGQVEIQNSRDKFIGYSAGNSEVVAYSYVASKAGNVDGRGKSQAEIMIGADNVNNQILAGSGGSSLWGGNGGTDTLTGGDGYDEFFYAMGSGNDVIQNAGDDDVVNLLGVSLSQISYAEVKSSDISIGFTDGGKLQLQGQSATGFKLEGVTYTANRSTGGWDIK